MMSYYGSTVWYQRVAAGLVSGHSIVHKFGQNAAVGTSFEPVCWSGVYTTPTTATALEAVSSDADDGAGGTGAREITVQGLNSSFEFVEQTVTMNGTTAVGLTTDLVRLFRWYVSSSGSYATATSGSQAGTITIRESGGGTTWSQLAIVDSIAAGQSLIGAYTVPDGKTAYLLSYYITMDTNKTVDFLLMQRPNADDVSSPYSGGLRTVASHVGLVAPFAAYARTPAGSFVGPCDIIVLAKNSVGTANVSIDFELLLIDD